MMKTRISLFIVLLLISFLGLSYYLQPQVVRSGEGFDDEKKVAKDLPDNIAVLKKQFEAMPSPTKANLGKYFSEVVGAKTLSHYDGVAKSVQDHTYNVYATYSRVAISNKNVGEHTERALAFIPEYKRYFYAYTLDKIKYEPHFFKYLDLLLEAYAKQKVSLVDLSEEISMVIHNGHFSQEVIKWFMPFIKAEIEAKEINNRTLKQYVSYLFYSNPDFKEWNDLSLALDEVEKSDAKSRVHKLQLVLKFLPCIMRHNIELSSETKNRLLKLCYESMLRCEPDGSFSDLYRQGERINQREYFYYASQFFDRDDMRFVSYGGWKNARALPPLTLDVLIKKTETCIIRNTWNILDVYQERSGYDNENPFLGENGFQITYENALSAMSVYSENFPQFNLHFKDRPQKLIGFEFDSEKATLKTDCFTMKVDKVAKTMEILFSQDLPLQIDGYKSILHADETSVLFEHLQGDSYVMSSTYAATRYKKRKSARIVFSDASKIKVVESDDLSIYTCKIFCEPQKRIFVELNVEIAGADANENNKDLILDQEGK